MYCMAYCIKKNVISHMTHLVPLSLTSVEEELCHRLLSFHFICLSNCNNILSTVGRHSVMNCWAMSLHGRNLILLCNRCNKEFSTLLTANQRSFIVHLLNTFCSVQFHTVNTYAAFTLVGTSVSQRW